VSTGEREVKRAMDSGSPLAYELAVYEQRRHELMGRAPGGYALICGDEVSLWHCKADAIQQGFERFGADVPFLVKEVCAVAVQHPWDAWVGVDHPPSDGDAWRNVR
jgi:hypothetical protein